MPTYLQMHIQAISEPAITYYEERGGIDTLVWVWLRSFWKMGVSLTVTCVAHMCMHVCTLKLCCRHSNNNSLASINFFGWEHSLLSSLFLSESLTVRRCAHTKTLSLTLNVAYTLSASASVFLFFSHPPQSWWIPRMTTHPPPLFAPLHSCLSARKQ